MPIISNNPVTVDGKTFDRFGVYLTVGPSFSESDVGPFIGVRFVRYRKDENGNIEQHIGDEECISFNILTSSDAAIEQTARDIMSSIQTLVNIKGL